MVLTAHISHCFHWGQGQHPLVMTTDTRTAALRFLRTVHRLPGAHAHFSPVLRAYYGQQEPVPCTAQRIPDLVTGPRAGNGTETRSIVWSLTQHSEKEEWAAEGEFWWQQLPVIRPRVPDRRLGAVSCEPELGWWVSLEAGGWGGRPGSNTGHDNAVTRLTGLRPGLRAGPRRAWPRLLLSELRARSLLPRHKSPRAEAELTKHQHRECKLCKSQICLSREPGQDYSDLGATIAFFFIPQFYPHFSQKPLWHYAIMHLDTVVISKRSQLEHWVIRLDLNLSENPL